MNFREKDMRSYYEYNIENASNYFLIKAGMCYRIIDKIKLLKVKLIKYETYHTETAFE